MAALQEPYMDPALLAKDYVPRLGMTDTVIARDKVERFMEDYLREQFGFFKHPTPLGMLASTGVNDDLDGSAHHQSGFTKLSTKIRHLRHHHLTVYTCEK
jgi:hypothetical protein